MELVLDTIQMYKLEADFQTSKIKHFPTQSSFECTFQAYNITITMIILLDKFRPD
jgi:hypothetical protein